MEQTQTEIVQMLIQDGCPVCLDVVKEPIETLCCRHFFCKKCYGIQLTSTGKCCYCRKQKPDIKYRNDLQLLILQQPMQCPNKGCEFILKRGKMDEHSSLKCDFALLSCIICKGDVIKKEYLVHLYKLHPQEFENKLAVVCQKQLPPRLELVKSNQNSINFEYTPLEFITNKKTNRVAKRGTTGNYYCRAPLGAVNCSCDGHCGPNNGCMCVDCMALTLKSMNIKESSILINCNNNMVHIKPEKNQVIGCYKSNYSKKVCGIDGHLCYSCEHLAGAILRYKKLYRD